MPPYQGGPVATPLPANVSRLPSATPLPANANQSPATSFAEDEPLDTRQDMLAIAAHTNTTTAPANEDDFLAPQRPTLALSAPQDDLPAPQQPPSPPEGADRRPTRLLIPSIAVDTPVKEVLVVGDTWEVAEYAAGYMEGTNVPGDYGNVGISGHLGLYGGVFANLSSLAIGGDVYVDAAGWRYHYRVRDRKVIWPTEVEILDPTLEPTLTLLTCTNWDTQRLAVIADLIASQPI